MRVKDGTKSSSKKILVLIIAFMIFPYPVNANNVATFTGASIQLVNAGGAPFGPITPLPLAAPVNYIIPWNTDAIITITGVAAVPGNAVGLEMYDYDPTIFNPDDLLDQHPNIPSGPGGVFITTLHIGCSALWTIYGGWAPGEVARTSGDFEAEIYIQDGDNVIPVGDYWYIRCPYRSEFEKIPGAGLNTIGLLILGMSLTIITFLSLTRRKYKN